jgi:hypothetical protein
MEAVIERCCGLDVHQSSVVACITGPALFASNQPQQRVGGGGSVALGVSDKMEGTLGQRYLDLMQQPSFQAGGGYGRRNGCDPHSGLHGSPHGFVGR